MPQADAQAGLIGLQAQQKEPRFRRAQGLQVSVRRFFPLTRGAQDGARPAQQFPVFSRARVELLVVLTEQAGDKDLFRRAGLLGPENKAGGAQAQAMPAVFLQQKIQGRGIGFGGLVAHRRVEALAFSVGFKGIAVEGHQGRAGGIGPADAPDRRMNAGDGRGFARRQADAARLLLSGAALFLPDAADVGLLMQKTFIFFNLKDAVFVQNTRVDFQIRKHFGSPCFQKGGHSLKPDVAGIAGQRCVVLPESGECFGAALGIALAVHAQQIAGVVPEEIGADAGTGLLARRGNQQGTGLALVVQAGQNAAQNALARQHQNKADQFPAVAGRGQLHILFFQHALVKGRQFAQNHARASLDRRRQSATSMMPPSRRGR